MAATERITMTMRELDRFKVIQDVADGKLKPWRAAERLELTTRQIRRLVARLREHGPAGLVSGHRSKPGNRRLDPGAADRALSIIRDRYADFGPTLACEKLRECHGIRLAKETVRKLMTEAGLWIPRRQRPPKVYQSRAFRHGRTSLRPTQATRACACIRSSSMRRNSSASVSTACEPAPLATFVTAQHPARRVTRIPCRLFGGARAILPLCRCRAGRSKHPG